MTIEQKNANINWKFSNPKSAELNKKFLDYCITDNHPFVIDLPKCKGMFIHTIDGQDIFDWSGLYGSKLLGYNHPGLYEKDYLDKLIFAANNKLPNPDYFTPECFEFYQMAKDFAPEIMKKSKELEVYAVNSGAEAVENMLKYLISKYNRKTGMPSDTPRRFIFFKNSFHGRTIFALSITRIHKKVITKDFHGLFSYNIQATFPAADFSNLDEPSISHRNRHITDSALSEIESYLEEYNKEVVAIVIEPIQSAGGHHVALPWFFTKLAELAHKYDVYLAFDEVQTGVAASGKRFLIDHYDLPYPPQALATAKKMGVGVLYMLDHLEDVGVLDSTWGGPLVDMVRVTQELKIVKRENLIQHAEEMGKYLDDSLRGLAKEFSNIIYNVRGVGLISGFTVLDPYGKGLRDKLIDIALKKNLLLLISAGTDSIRLRPNLSVTKKEIDLFIELLADSLLTLQKGY